MVEAVRAAATKDLERSSRDRQAYETRDPQTDEFSEAFCSPFTSTSATPRSPARPWRTATRRRSTSRSGPTGSAVRHQRLRASRLARRIPAQPADDARGDGGAYDERAPPDRRADRSVPRPAPPRRGPGGARQPEQGTRRPGRRRRYVRDEFAMFGVPTRERAKRVTEAVTTLKAAFTGEPFEYRGRTVHVTPGTVPPGRADRLFLAAAASRRRGEPPVSPTGSSRRCPRSGSSTGTRSRSSAVPTPAPARSARTGSWRWRRTPRTAWQEMAPFFLHETNAYGVWQAQDRCRAVPHRRATSTNCEPTRPVPSPHTREFVAELKASPFPSPAPPVCGGMPPELAWSSLRLLERDVLPGVRPRAACWDFELGAQLRALAVRVDGPGVAVADVRMQRGRARAPRSGQRRPW